MTPALRTTVIALGGQAASQILRLGSNLILTRLLYPEAFGLMALVLLTVQGLHMVSDVGIYQSIVAHKRGDDPAFLDTAWTVGALRGLLLFAGASLLAWPFSIFYEQPELRLLVPVLALTAVFSGLESTKVAVAAREMQNGRVVLLDLGTQVCALAINVAVAFATHSVWALVAGTCASAGLRALASHVLLPGRLNRPRFERETVDALVSFGKWVLVSTLITFLASRLDVLLLGKLLPIDVLGVYTLAALLATIPGTVAGVVAGSVVAPLLGRAFRESFATLQDAFARLRGFLLPAIAFVVLGTGLGAPPFFALFYDARYHDAMWMTPLLMLQVWFSALHESSARALVAMGDARPLVVANFAKLAVAAACAMAGHALYGLPGFIIGNGAGALAGFVTLGAVLERRGLRTLRGDLGWSAVIILVSGGAYVAGPALARASGLAPVTAYLVVAIVVVGAFAALVGPRALRDYRSR